MRLFRSGRLFRLTGYTASLFSVMLVLVTLMTTGVFGDFAQAQSGLSVTALDTLRLRAGPGTEFPVLATVPWQTRLTAIARNETGEWVRVLFEGLDGWLVVAFLQVDGDVMSLPVGSPVPEGLPTPGAPPDGAILSLDLYAQTAHVSYYRMTYWSDGLQIVGFLAEPIAPGRYPAVIYNRGGTRETGALRGYEFVPFAEAGFVVAASQYRGGPSQGADEFGGADVSDVLNLIPLLRSRPQVDPSRIAMFGSSRGAMMTYIALRRLAESGTNDIAVAATTSGLADLFMWARERTDLNSGLYPELIGATTLSNPAAFRERSATYWPGLIRAPLLIMHGDADGAVSVEQSRRLYSGMRAAGRTVQLIVVPGGDHGLSGHEAGMRDVLRWFNRYLARDGEDFTLEVHHEAISQAYLLLLPR